MVTIEAKGSAAMVAVDGTPVGACRAAFVHLHAALVSLGFVGVHLATGFVRYQPAGVTSANHSLRAVLCIGRTQGGEVYVKRCQPSDDVSALDETAWRQVDKHNGRRLGFTGEPDTLCEARSLAATLAVSGVDSGAPWRAVVKALDDSLDADVLTVSDVTSATPSAPSSPAKPSKRSKRSKAKSKAGASDKGTSDVSELDKAIASL